MRVLACIASCKRDQENGRNQVNRDTWIKEWGDQIDHKFLLGKDCLITQTDELLFPHIPDDYGSVVFKQVNAYRWALARGYDYVIHCANDEYMAVPRLLKSGFEQHDYMGRRAPGDIHAACHFVSRKAMEAIVAVETRAEYADRWDGLVLAGAGITLHDDPRAFPAAHEGRQPFHPADWAVWEAGVYIVNLGRNTGTFEPQWMRECHESYMAYRYLTGRD